MASQALQPTSVSSTAYVALSNALKEGPSSRADAKPSAYFEGLTYDILSSCPDGFYVNIKAKYHVLLKIIPKFTMYSNTNGSFYKLTKVEGVTINNQPSDTDGTGAEITINGGKFVNGEFNFNTILDKSVVGFNGIPSIRFGMTTADHVTRMNNDNTLSSFTETGIFPQTPYWDLVSPGNSFDLMLKGVYNIPLHVNLSFNYPEVHFRNNLPTNATLVSDFDTKTGEGVVKIDGASLLSEGITLIDLFPDNSDYTITLADETFQKNDDAKSDRCYSIIENCYDEETTKLLFTQAPYSNFNNTQDNGGIVYIVTIPGESLPLFLRVQIDDKLKDVDWYSTFSFINNDGKTEYITNAELIYHGDIDDGLKAKTTNSINLHNIFNTDVYREFGEHFDKTNSINGIWNQGLDFINKFRNFEFYHNGELLISNYGYGNDAGKDITDSFQLHNLALAYQAPDNEGVVWYAREFKIQANQVTKIGGQDVATSEEAYNNNNSLVRFQYDDADETYFFRDQYNNYNYWWGNDDTYTSLNNARIKLPPLWTDYGFDLSTKGLLSTTTAYTGFGIQIYFNLYFDYAYGKKRLGQSSAMFNVWFNRYRVAADARWPHTDTTYDTNRDFN